MARRTRSPVRPVQPTTNKVAPSKPASLLDDPIGTWRAGRILALEAMPLWGPAILALNPIFSTAEESKDRGLPTMAVDSFYRCYVNLGFVETLVAEAKAVSPSNPCPNCGATSHHPLAYVAGVIVHESQHPARGHADRAKEVFSDPRLHKTWNIAADLEINDDSLVTFKASFQESQQNYGSTPQVCFPKGVMLPKIFAADKLQETLGASDEEFAKVQTIPVFRNDDIAESYFIKLRQIQDQLPTMPTFPGGAECGSGAHGEEKPWELGEPTDEHPGVSKGEGRSIAREVANNVRKRQLSRGDVPAGTRMWAEKVLTPPKVNWRSKFRRVVRRAAKRQWGHANRTWTRFGRTSISSGFKVLTPSTYNPTPRVGVVLDTSGSMGTGEGSPLMDAVSEVQGICKAVGVEVTFVSVDSAASAVEEVKDIRKAKLSGGGGTDMRVGISLMAKLKDPPSVVVVLTDGYTPWPAVAPKGMGVIAALVGGNGALSQIPKWLMPTTVVVE